MLAQLLASGIALGAIYALIALSMTVVFRATTVVNFAHGDLVMGGAFVVYGTVVLLGIPYLGGAVAAIVVLFGLGMLMERTLIRPVALGPHITLAMMTVAAGYLMRGVARYFWGREVLPMPSLIEVDPVFLGSVVLTPDEILITLTVLAAMVVFFIVFHLTETGRTIQAVYQSERGAWLVGINVRRFHLAMWGVGAAMGGLAGILVAPVTLLYPDMGASMLIRGFAAMTLGGFGSIPGAVIGGLLLGVMENVFGGYISTALIDITAYLVIILVLTLRPSGLFGRPATVRV